jgi:hypothetical protein
MCVYANRHHSSILGMPEQVDFAGKSTIFHKIFCGKFTKIIDTLIKPVYAYVGQPVLAIEVSRCLDPISIEQELVA